MKYYVHRAVVFLKGDGGFMLIEHYNHETVKGVARAKAKAELERLGYKDYKIIESNEVNEATYACLMTGVVRASLVGDVGTTE